eukprot:m.149663 g.149663  ORF g.149663 m.149663 type:complete len:254 (-) comp11672_c0_seq4:1107-1868(-)
MHYLKGCFDSEPAARGQYLRSHDNRTNQVLDAVISSTVTIWNDRTKSPAIPNCVLRLRAEGQRSGGTLVITVTQGKATQTVTIRVSTIVAVSVKYRQPPPHTYKFAVSDKTHVAGTKYRFKVDAVPRSWPLTVSARALSKYFRKDVVLTDGWDVTVRLLDAANLLSEGTEVVALIPNASGDDDDDNDDADADGPYIDGNDERGDDDEPDHEHDADTEEDREPEDSSGNTRSISFGFSEFRFPKHTVVGVYIEQ